MANENRPYHHGDLHNVLLRVAEAELAERGIEAFSLRSVAKRAGVSHAAPAHHFGDTDGLLTALAAKGFREFLAAMTAREARAGPDPQSQVVAAGRGYVDFALERPALFRLLFGSTRPCYANPELELASNAAFRHLVDLVQVLGGDTATDVPAIWAVAHGLADLLASGRLKMVGNSAGETDAMVDTIIRKVLPQG